MKHETLPTYVPKTFLQVYADSEVPDQPDRNLPIPLTESLGTTERFNGEQVPGWDFAKRWMNSESVHLAHARRHIFAGHGPIV